MSEQSTFNVSLRTAPDEVIATLVGELDLASGELLHADLGAFTGQRIRLEMHDVTFLDSSGLRALLMLRAQTLESGGSLAVTSTSEQVQRLFEVAGVASMFLEPGTELTATSV